MRRGAKGADGEQRAAGHKRGAGGAAMTADIRVRVLLIAIRQAVIIVLGALEDYLRMDRSITPKHRR